MVISMAYYGWGAKGTVSHVTLFLGITVHRSTRDFFFKTLTLNCVELFRSLLASRQSGLMVWDNFNGDRSFVNSVVVVQANFSLGQ